MTSFCLWWYDYRKCISWTFVISHILISPPYRRGTITQNSAIGRIGWCGASCWSFCCPFSSYAEQLDDGVVLSGLRHVVLLDLRTMTLVKQELHSLPEHLSSPPVLVRFVFFFSFVYMFCRSLFVLFYFFVAVVLSVYRFWFPVWYLQTLLPTGALLRALQL
jgi:hypothetical protein